MKTFLQPRMDTDKHGFHFSFGSGGQTPSSVRSMLAFLGSAALLANSGCSFRQAYDDSPLVRQFGASELKKTFPIGAGMTLSEVDRLKPETHPQYSLNWREKWLRDGTGHLTLWATGDEQFYCDVIVVNRSVRSVWIMPGTREWSTGVFHRISGKGKRTGYGPDEWTDPKAASLARATRELKNQELRPDIVEELQRSFRAENAIPILRPLLESPAPDVRAIAVEVIGRIAPTAEATPLLIHSLSDPSHKVLSAAVSVIASSSSEFTETSAPLAKLVYRKEFDLLDLYVPVALASMGESTSTALPVLTDALKDEREWVILNSLECLSRISSLGSPVRKAIQELKTHQNSEIRTMASNIL